MINSIKFGIRCVFILVCLTMLSGSMPASGQKNLMEPTIPHLEVRHGAIQLIVAGKPFTMISGELHNSTSSAPEYFDDAIKNARQMNVNTIIASIAWEQFEPEENHFDFSLLDHIIKAAHDSHLKLVLIWFASWKNGESSYVPLWIKKDTKRFFHIKDKTGRNMSGISPFCKAAMQADAAAFLVLMQHIRLKNQFSDVVMIQVENEVGAFSDIDYGNEAQALYHADVPSALIRYLQLHKGTLDKYIKDAWQENGSKTRGTWPEIFGEKNLTARHLFMTWYYASYINEVCKCGKAAYELPMYVNAWQDHDGQLPGKFPNGGPVAKVMDIYKCIAPFIDFISPDIYLPNFREICDKYFKPEKKNPLFIPECERTNPGKAFYALGQDNAIGFGPFGIESIISNRAYAQSNAVLRELLPVITQYQGTGHMRAFLQQGDEDSASMNMGKYHITIKYAGKGRKLFGIIIQAGAHDYLIAGMDCRITFSSMAPRTIAQIGKVLEGAFRNNEWHTVRQLNGDETSDDHVLIVGSRSYIMSCKMGIKHVKEVLAPIPVLNQQLESKLQTNYLKAPAIYKVKMYDIPE